jgi:8-oxo-dGTP diphosphatase
MKKSVNVVIIDNQGKILVLKRNSHDKSYPCLWDLPGGGVKNNETLHEAAKREVFEEGGLKVEPDKDYFFMIDFIEDEESNYAFNAKFINGKVKISKEHTEFMWVSKDNWKNIEYTPGVTAIIDEFFKKNK